MQISSIQNYNCSYKTTPKFKSSVRFSENYRDQLRNIAYSQFPEDIQAGQRVADIYMKSQQLVEAEFAKIDFDILKLVKRVMKTNKNKLNPDVYKIVIEELMANPKNRDLIIDKCIMYSMFIAKNDDVSTNQSNANIPTNAFICDCKTTVLNDVLPFETQVNSNPGVANIPEIYGSPLNLPGNIEIPLDIFGTHDLITTAPNITNTIFSIATFNPKYNMPVEERQNISTYFYDACLPLVESSLKTLSFELNS